MSYEGSRPRDDDETKLSLDPLTTLIKEVSLSSYRVSALDKKFDEVFKEFREDLKGMKSSHVLKSDFDHMDNRVKKIEEIISWGTRIVVGMILMALVGLVLAKGGASFR